MCNYINNGAKAKGKNHKFWIKKIDGRKNVLDDDDDDSDDSDDDDEGTSSLLF